MLHGTGPPNLNVLTIRGSGAVFAAATPVKKPPPADTAALRRLRVFAKGAATGRRTSNAGVQASIGPPTRGVRGPLVA
jgi:hypothetical protein